MPKSELCFICVKGRSWGISVGFEILVKKSRVEDTQAYREMTRMSYETFCEILTAALVILPYFGLSPFLEKTADRKISYNIICSFKWQKLSSTIMSNFNMSKLHDS